MSQVAYCPKCQRVTLSNDVPGFNTCPDCGEKFVFTDINQHTWYLKTPEEKNVLKSQWFGTDRIQGTDTTTSFPHYNTNRNVQLENIEYRNTQVETKEAVNFVLSTTNNIEGHSIRQYLGVCSCHKLVSRQNPISSKMIEDAKQQALEGLKINCATKGANAAVGISLSIAVSPDALLISADGTAVSVS